jgi:hypothetical protein
LGFDELVHNLRCSGLAFGIATGNAALVLEGQSTEVGKPDLGVVLLSYSLGNVCRGPFTGMLGLLKACLLTLFVTAPRFTQAVSTAAIKTTGGS